MSREAFRGRLHPHRTPGAGAISVGAFAAPSPAATADRQSSVRDGIIRATRDPHPRGAVGPDASIEIDRTAAAVIDNSVPDLPTEAVGSAARSGSGRDDDAPCAVVFAGGAQVSRLRQCGGGDRCNNQNCCGTMADHMSPRKLSVPTHPADARTSWKVTARNSILGSGAALSHDTPEGVQAEDLGNRNALRALATVAAW